MTMKKLKWLNCTNHFIFLSLDTRKANDDNFEQALFD